MVTIGEAMDFSNEQFARRLADQLAHERATGQAIIHRCACCKRGYTGPEWGALEYRGRQFNLEFRQCATPACNNTLTEEIR